MQKPRLMTPGPAPVPEDVLLELARPVIHHRSAEAKQVIIDVAAGLKEVFQTRNDVLILTASGTGAMEAAAVNAVPRGGKALVLHAGHFAQRWGSICKAFGINAVMLDTEWGKPVDPAKLVNYGANRWAFKPEIGVSRRWGNWLLDGYGALAFFKWNSTVSPWRMRMKLPGTVPPKVQNV